MWAKKSLLTNTQTAPTTYKGNHFDYPRKSIVVSLEECVHFYLEDLLLNFVAFIDFTELFFGDIFRRYCDAV